MSYTILKALILPPGGIILLLLMGFFLVRGLLGRIFIFTALSLLTLMSLPAVAERLAAGLEPYPALEPDQLANTGADAILILGSERYSWAPEYGGDTIGERTLQRVRYGAFLSRHTGLPVYVTGGSPPDEGVPVGRLMARVLEDECGVKLAGLEDQSRTTWENAELSVPMLRRNAIRWVLLVTHAWHMRRAVDAFERVGIQVIPAPTAFIHREPGEGRYTDWLPSAGAFEISYYAVHEYLGQAWYQLKDTLSSGDAERANAGVL
jgi:uncharacterized SAM-binding protein YcdF (DUF218 family)